MGSLGAKGTGGGGRGIIETGGEISGEVSFADIVKSSDNTIDFGKIVTVLPKGYIPDTGKKSDLGTLVDKYNINDARIELYDDKAGANDIKRLADLGFEVVAWYRNPTQPGSKIPDKMHMFVKRTSKNPVEVKNPFKMKYLK